MFTFKATLVFAAPLLAAAASEVIPSRVQRRAALLELLEHQNEKRQSESYGTPDICKPNADPSNDSRFISLAEGNRFADTSISAFAYAGADASCVTSSNCQASCIADAEKCIGYSYSSTPACTLYGAYGGAVVTNVPANFFLIQDAGSNSESVATCATKTSTLDQVDTASGGCTCAPGRRQGANAFVCETDTVPAGSFTKPKTLTKPVDFVSPITWDNAIEAVPAVLDSNQCAAICQADSKCEAYLLQQSPDLNKCWKIGASGSYSSPAAGNFPFTQTAARMAKRQAVGQSGSVGLPGDVFGQPSDSTLINDAAEPTPSAGARMRMRVKRAHSHVQW